MHKHTHDSTVEYFFGRGEVNKKPRGREKWEGHKPPLVPLPPPLFPCMKPCGFSWLTLCSLSIMYSLYGRGCACFFLLPCPLSLRNTAVDGLFSVRTVTGSSFSSAEVDMALLRLLLTAESYTWITIIKCHAFMCCLCVHL